MSHILCIETATTNCSVSVCNNGKLLALVEDNGKNYSHAERLHTSIQKVLQKANLNKSQLNAIAVSKGPGSYTGLRIGVSAAKGLCYALDLPLIALPTLHVLAQQVQQETDYIIPMLDARRMEVYAAVFDANYNSIRETKAEILSETSYSNYLDQGKVAFIGNGVEKFAAVCQHPNAVFIADKLPSAREMCAPATEKFFQNDFENLAYFEPFYLKDFMMK